MNCTYCTDMETGRTIYGQRRQQPAGLASYQARKAAQEAASLAPYSVEKNSYYSSAPWIVKFDGKAIGEFFPTKKAAIAGIEEQKQKKQKQEQERPETISTEQKEEKNVYTWPELKTMENRFDIKKTMQDDVKTLETIYGNNVGMYSARPDETISEYVQAVGYGRACAAVASLVNRSAWDGRIDKRNAAWAVSVAGALDEECCEHFSIYTNRIHMGHLNQLADVLRKFTPDETPDDHSETTDETPAQDAEQTETPDDHSAQEQPAEKKEEKTMKKVEFAQDAIIVNGQEYAARYEYGETPRGHYLPTIRIYTALSGSACVVELPDDDSEYDNARAAMEKAQEQPETPAQDAEQTETPDDHSAQAQEEPQEQPAQDAEQEQQPAEQAQELQEQPDETPAPTAREEPQEQAQEPQTETPDDHSETTDETPAEQEQEPQEQEQPAPDPKQARGPVPEKTFIGTSISGHGYSIVFDGGCNRTRVIVTDDVKEKARPIIEKAGFYYSAALDSWNKKLTFRAYRAAQALAAELEKALAA